MVVIPRDGGTPVHCRLRSLLLSEVRLESIQKATENYFKRHIEILVKKLEVTITKSQKRDIPLELRHPMKFFYKQATQINPFVSYSSHQLHMRDGVHGSEIERRLEPENFLTERRELVLHIRMGWRLRLLSLYDPLLPPPLPETQTRVRSWTDH